VVLGTAEKIDLRETAVIELLDTDFFGEILIRISESRVVVKILKDLDFLELEPGGISTDQGEGWDWLAGVDRIRDLFGSITEDVKYLQDNKIMDYSLLVTKVDLGKMDGGMKEKC
jgi:hypothetical protein